MGKPEVVRRPVPLPDSTNSGQHSVLEQAQAAAAAQSNVLTPDGYEAPVEDVDLVSLGSAQDDLGLPPPAYGDIYGEISDEKEGIDTSARVTDDGRVNIRINQLNRRLSQIFTPALRAQLQSVEEDEAPSLYVPPSLAGQDEGPRPPPLAVVIQVVGSRGDVQPFVALGKVLKQKYGHRVRVATHPNFQNFVEENGLEFFNIGGDPSRLMAFMVKNPGLMPGFDSLLKGDVKQRRKDVAEYIQGCWRSCYKAGNGIDEDDPENPAPPFVADCIIANPPSFAHVHCAEKLGIPLHIMFTMPYSPTQAFPHPLANVQSNADTQLTNYISYAMIEVLSWQALGDIINRFRTKCLRLEPVSLIWAPGMLQRLKVPHTYCWSPALIPKPKDWGKHISVAGFFLLDSPGYVPPPELQAFLDAGPAPVYIGFGSIVLRDPDAMTEIVLWAAKQSGQRIILSKGWGGMGADELHVPDSVFLLKHNVPHDWLFQHVSCVVHHGGAGTTAAGISAGRPTLIVPFFGDQPFWGAMVARAGAGPEPIPHKQLTADRLVEAINFCLRPESLARAKELASRIAAERGNENGAQSFHNHLQPDRLRCTLIPSRAAAWRLKRTQIRLSTFAACTLANANLLDFHDLKLFRAQEYETDEGPWDPISGGATAIFGAFSNMVMGVVDMPTETWRAVKMPYKASRKSSQASLSNQSGTAGSSRARGSSTSTFSPQRSQTNLSMQESLSSTRKPDEVPRLSFRSSDVGSLAESSRGPSTPKGDGASLHQVQSRTSTKASKEDKDMMRRKGAHTSKGFGRIVKASVEAPMEISMAFTKGFHNMPKLYGDDTVRPQEQVTGVSSGFKAMGKEFGFGFYDGITGLVTQPFNGARKEGFGGFAKGVGKGLGGLVVKPGAALFGIPSYFMKGFYKEAQNLFGSNVQNYIVASRAAQGYEEWLQSSEQDKQDVVERWKLVQKYMKKRKNNADEVVLDLIESHQRRNGVEESQVTSPAAAKEVASQASELEGPRSAIGHDIGLVGSPSYSETPPEVVGSSTLSTNGEILSSPPLSPTSTEEPLEITRTTTIPRRPVPGRSRAATQDTGETETINSQVSSAHTARRRREAQQADLQNLRDAVAASEAEAARHAQEAKRYEEQLRLAMEQSLRHSQSSSSDLYSVSDIGLNSDEDEEFERAEHKTTVIPQPRPLPADSGHLAGVTREQFEARGSPARGEKSAEERQEEEIVLAYIKKQSLLEQQHRAQQSEKSRSSVMADAEHEAELRRAMLVSREGDDSPLSERAGARLWQGERPD